jgi:hypothetical protein
MIDYDGRRFSPVTDVPGHQPVAHYHQSADLVWGEFAGGDVRRGTLVGTTAPDGVLQFAYCMVFDSGKVVTGLCRSVPKLLADGRVRLTEYWERYGPDAGSGMSTLEELPVAAPGRR